MTHALLPLLALLAVAQPADLPLEAGPEPGLSVPGGTPLEPGRRAMAWRRLDVTARLDAGGALHVVERQELVLNGDWNGGERIFNVRPGQRLRFERLVRVAPDGREVPLARGDLGAVDRYDLPQRHVVRWRARAPSDPPFAMATLVYVLEYTLEGVLARQGDGRYLLTHDFAFPDRRWAIGRATAALDLDPAWEAEAGLRLAREGGPLLPGQGFGMIVPLRRLAAAGPLRLPGDPLPGAVRLAAAAAFALLLAAGALAVHRHGAARGQYAPGPRPEEVDAAFLETHVRSLPPEVVGAAWDESVGPPEVAAVLARLAVEGKLSTRLEAGRRWPLRREVLHLRLLVPRESLAGHERALVKGLFVDGDTIDSDRLRAHYRRRGFDPAERIGPEVLRQVEALAPAGAQVSRWGWNVAGGLLLAAAAALVAAGLLRGGREPWVLLTIPFAGAAVFAAVVLAWRLRRRAIRLAGAAAPPLLHLALWAGLLLWIAGGGLAARGFVLGDLDLAAHALAWLAGLALAVGAARTSLGPERLALRRRLAAARDCLARELDRPAPRLDDSWTPWLLALGLGPDLDRWTRVHGAAAAAGRAGHAGGSFGGGGRAGGPAWTGGGGGFSGGGATGTWAALGGMAASIPSPGSGGSGGSGSSGGGGGGGGAGSGSGGGGGGGW